MSERGPSRIVLLDSGGFQYGEFHLDGPIQLVAANNVGKTTMIASVQFLYIDSFDQMHFAHSEQETKRHYFPRSSSFVLFECVTPRGYAVVGVHGLGPVQSFAYERFLYEGAYKREDFFDGRTPRSWEDIRSRLADREFRLLDPTDYRRAVLGAGLEGVLPLALVPLSQQSAYDSFRFLFRNLLQLARLNQKKLKALLIDVEGTAIRRRVVNVATQFRELHARLKRDTAEVFDLRQERVVIESLLSLRDRRDTLRGALHSTWRQIERLHREGREAFEAERHAHLREIASIETREVDLGARRDIARKALTRATSERTTAEARLQDLDELAKRLGGFLPELAQRALAGLDNEISALDVRLDLLQAYDETELRRKTAHCGTDLERVRERLHGIDDSVGARLVAELGGESVGRLFRILHPDLLAVPNAQVEVVSERRARDGLNAMVTRVSATGYRDDGVRIGPENLPTVDLADYLDAEQMRIRIHDLTKEHERLERAGKDQKERTTLVQKRDEKEREREGLRKNIADWAEWTNREKERPALTTAAEASRKNEAEKLLADETTERERIELAAEKAKLDVRWTGRRDEWEKIDRAVRNCDPPPEEWPLSSAESPPTALAELIEMYRRQRAEEARAAVEVSEKLAYVESKTASRHSGTSEEETFGLLREALDALDEKSRAVEELWRSLATGLRSEFKGMREDLHRLERRTRKLTKDLEARKVSNLTRFAIDFVADRVWLKRIDAVIEEGERPLLANPAETREALNWIAKILEDREQVALEDLFSLEFRVFGPGGAERRFESLDAIESHGTTITIKVLVQLELMHGLLRETEAVRLPFFLDEVSALDDANLEAIVGHARAMGFLPLLASPDPKTASEVTYYYLSGEPGRLVIEEGARMELRREEPRAS